MALGLAAGGDEDEQEFRESARVSYLRALDREAEFDADDEIATGEERELLRRGAKGDALPRTMEASADARCLVSRTGSAHWHQLHLPIKFVSYPASR